jgi:hypothetical protein
MQYRSVRCNAVCSAAQHKTRVFDALMPQISFPSSCRAAGKQYSLENLTEDSKVGLMTVSAQLCHPSS